MLSKVIAQFPFAADGFTVELIQPGTVRDFGDATRGLRDERLIVPNEEAPRSAQQQKRR